MFVIGTGAGRGSQRGDDALRSVMDSLGAASFSTGELNSDEEQGGGGE